MLAFNIWHSHPVCQYLYTAVQTISHFNTLEATTTTQSYHPYRESATELSDECHRVEATIKSKLHKTNNYEEILEPWPSVLEVHVYTEGYK